MYSVIAKDGEPYVYQQMIFLGILSTLNYAKNYIIQHHAKTISMRQEEKVATYGPYEYQYFIFESDVDKEIELNEKDAIFVYNIDV